MTRYRFPGYTTFLRDAAQRLDLNEAEAPARRSKTLAALGNLCAQAGDADPEHVPAIMAKAAEFRDQLLVAYEAAELMLRDVHRATGPDPDRGRVKQPSRPARRGEKKEKTG